jgi:hypothetical protein
VSSANVIRWILSQTITKGQEGRRKKKEERRKKKEERRKKKEERRKM